MNDNILVTGMSGLIGGAVRQRLEPRARLSALNRSEVPGVTTVRADLADLDAIRPAFEGRDTVIHLAAKAGDRHSWEALRDTNVIGTKPGLERPRIGAIYVRSLTPETHGNATGIGQADVMPRHLLEEIDLHSTYMNTFTAKRLAGSKMPLMAENDLQAMQVCLTVRAEEDPATARVVRIRNTNLLAEFDASPGLREEIEANPSLEVLDEAKPLRFDERGNFA